MLRVVTFLRGSILKVTQLPLTFSTNTRMCLFGPMTPNYRKRLVRWLLVLITFLALVQAVQACVCSKRDDSTLGKFDRARFVVVNKIISVQKEPRVRIIYSGKGVIREPIMTIVSIKMIVEKVYKGDLKVGDDMIFGQGESDCLVEFDENEVGTEFLFYLEPKETKPKIWYADSCQRSTPLPNYPSNYIADAAHDLLYLNKMNEVRGKTRISGTLISYQWSITKGSADFKKLARRRVQIVGNGKTYEVLTNEDGVYEIYDLPVETYAIRPEVRQGWEIDKDSAFGGFSSGRNEDDGNSEVELKAGRHAYSDFFFKVNNRLSGRILDGLGRPLQSVCLRLLPTQSDVFKDFNREDCTDADGRFEIKEIPFASYVMVINDADKISSRQPFRRFYYPDVTDREKAQVITIDEGDTRYLLDINIAGAKEIATVTGRVLSADGKPVVFARVVFTSAQTDATINGNAFAMTDQEGNFSLKVLKGLSGRLFAAVTLDPNEFKNCPAILRDRGEISLDRKTDAIRIQADGHIVGVELKLPFPSCNGEKIHSQIRVD